MRNGQVLAEGDWTCVGQTLSGVLDVVKQARQLTLNRYEDGRTASRSTHVGRGTTP